MINDNNLTCKARTRLSYLFDDGSYTELNSSFKENSSSERSAVVCAYGYVNGMPVYAFSQDISVNDGAVDYAHARKISKLYSLAAKTGIPVVGIHDSNGAFIDGSLASLAAYSDILSASSLISGVVPQISIIAGTCAGSASLVACSSDFVVMTKDSELFMTPPSTSKNSSGSSDAAAKAGIAAIVEDDDKSAVEKTRELLTLLPQNNLSGAPSFDSADANPAVPSDFASTISCIADDADSIIELYPDFGDAAYTALACVGGSAVGIAATNKSSQKLTPDDCTKLAKFVRTCDAFSIPLVTVIATEGFGSSSDSDVAADIRSMTKLANSYAESTNVKIALVAGKAVGPAFIALAGKTGCADMVFAWNNAVISPMPSDTAVEFLWRDKLMGVPDVNAKRNELISEYEQTLACAEAAAEIDFVDEIISPDSTRQSIIGALKILAGKRVSKLPKKHNNIPL